MFFSLNRCRIARPRASASRGFTLIELLVVLVILTLLAGLVGPKVLDQLSGAKVKTARVQIGELEQAADLFKLDVGRYPTDAEGLRGLAERPATARGWNGPYLKKGLPEDPWGHAYQYKFPGRGGNPDIFTFGADGRPGGDGENADVYN
ncbi:MAG: type II secretion system protein GspG [Comamonas sp. SCN 65-56]|uniref:type II secretion system major pseudopilin GspG n=1 Tax=Comamonas sp. SCN 65-56 TaxID=1660095 RepID=UPI00086C8C91|nr:type II secretion system major pseudopilin GspG [Comamonas sp. SCN 65-56]ODS90853.1 MAG: type II secretion system protein GspG [Comamonas sp. SCN 65-56]